MELVLEHKPIFRNRLDDTAHFIEIASAALPEPLSPETRNMLVRDSGG